jgi:hypothetical protein
MGKAFADRWGVPVRAGRPDAVALLDEAIEDLAALAGLPGRPALVTCGPVVRRVIPRLLWMNCEQDCGHRAKCE